MPQSEPSVKPRACSLHGLQGRVQPRSHRGAKCDNRHNLQHMTQETTWRLPWSLTRGMASLALALIAARGLAQPADVLSHACFPKEQDVPWQALGPGVWAWLPVREADIDRGNAGHVAPTVAVIDRGEALLIDPGPHHLHGLRVRKSLRCRFGVRPVWIVNTHAHAENVLANSAFADLQRQGKLRIAASAPTMDAMRKRCPDCLASLTSKLGHRIMRGTRIVLPETVLQVGDVLRVGARRLRVHAIERAHTEGDLVLWDEASRILFVGGLAYGRRVPELAQGRLSGWLAALKGLAEVPARGVLGTSWSPVSEGQIAETLSLTLGYLGALRDAVQAAMDTGQMAPSPTTAALEQYRAWPGYDERHHFNVQRAWRELEADWFQRTPTRQSQ